MVSGGTLLLLHRGIGMPAAAARRYVDRGGIHKYITRSYFATLNATIKSNEEKEILLAFEIGSEGDRFPHCCPRYAKCIVVEFHTINIVVIILWTILPRGRGRRRNLAVIFPGGGGAKYTWSIPSLSALPPLSPVPRHSQPSFSDTISTHQYSTINFNIHRWKCCCDQIYKGIKPVFKWWGAWDADATCGADTRRSTEQRCDAVDDDDAQQLSDQRPSLYLYISQYSCSGWYRTNDEVCRGNNISRM